MRTCLTITVPPPVLRLSNKHIPAISPAHQQRNENRIGFFFKVPISMILSFKYIVLPPPPPPPPPHPPTLLPTTHPHRPTPTHKNIKPTVKLKTVIPSVGMIALHPYVRPSREGLMFVISFAIGGGVNKILLTNSSAVAAVWSTLLQITSLGGAARGTFGASTKRKRSCKSSPA